MLRYTANIKLNDSNDHIVTGKIVTVPEIAILRRIHGPGAITVTGKADPSDASDAAERERLSGIYDHPTPDAEPLVNRVFGGDLTPLPRRLADVGIDPGAQAKELRRQAAAMAKAAAVLADEEPVAQNEDVDDMFDEEDAA